jgi:deoxyribose-phosphate aldolase
MFLLVSGLYVGKTISELISMLRPSDLAGMIDHTLLKPNADYKTLEKYIEDARK